MKKRHKIETFILCFIVAVTVIMFYLHHQLPNTTDRTKYFPRTGLAVLRHKNPKNLEPVGKNPKNLETVENPKNLEPVDNPKNLETTDKNPKNLEPVAKIKTCSIDAECEHLETCLSGTCVIFWPSKQTNQSNCHRACEKDLQLHEKHFYLKNITDVSAFEGISNDTCVLKYSLSGNTPGLSVTEYERRQHGAVARVESIDSHLGVALCNEIEHEMVVVTGANSGYFHALENFIGSMHFWEPTRQLVVYNLGLSASQIEQVKTWHNVHLEWPNGIPSTYAPHVHALKKYAWKTNAIYESTKKYAATLWLDAGCEVRGPLTDIESILRKDGVFLVQGQDGDMTRWVHDETLRYFNVERSAFSKKPSFAGGIEGWILNSKAYHQILEPLVECANKKECIDPVGASLGNHRYDQSALSVITYKSGMNIVPHTEFLAAQRSQLHADIKKPNPMCIWTARGGSSAYKQYTKSVNKLKKPLTSIKHYVVFSTTTGVTHARDSDYDFLAALTAKNWHNLGYIPIVVVVSDQQSHIDVLTEKWSDILPAEAIVIPLVTQHNNAIPVAQISRLFVSLMLPDLPHDSILSTTDADMMIMDKSRFAMSGDTDIEIFNGNCCGAYQFPMHSVTMPVQKWRSLFQQLWHNEKSFEDNIIQTTKTFGFESNQQIRHGGAHWSMDQQILSSIVRKSNFKLKLSPGPSRRLHVGNPLSSEKYTDIHLAGFNIKRHNTWMEKMIQMFSKLSVDISTYKEYKDKWYGESHPKAIVNIQQKITIKNSMGFNRDEPCDITCHYTTGGGPVDATVYELRGRRAPPSGISVYMQMEGEHYYPIDTTDWTVENTYRWSSPILKPYIEWLHYHGETDIQSKRVAQDAIDGVSFLARNCGSKNHREQVVKDLMSAGIRVDSMSSCLHNHEKPGTDDKIDIMKRYKFHAAFENGNVRDYVTEKVYLALAAGTVPIYLGAPNIDEFVPKGSIIRVDSFENTAALAQHVQECIANETLYQSYHEWRDRPLNSEFVERFAFTNVTTECRTCRWVYAHKHGLPWDKKSQTFELGSKEIFEKIAATNEWGDPESISGAGSTVEVNRFRVQCLKEFIQKHDIKNVYDIPCGDANWQHGLLTNNVQYYGSDISNHALEQAKRKNKKYESMHFLESINLIDSVPNVDLPEHSLFLSKEVIQHLPLKDGVSMLNNIKKSGVRYLAATNHDTHLFNVKKNNNIETGSFYPNNLFLPPFHFHKPMVDCSDLLQTDSEKKRYGNMLIFDLGTVPYFKRFSNDSIFVKTGDIPDMWIRDSTAQVWPLRDDGPLVEKVLNMQSFFILQDPYANSYRDHKVQSPTREDLKLGREGWVATRNYELDSGCYFIRLLHYAWKHHDLSVQKYRQTVETLVNTWKTEQYHEEKSPYRYPELPRNGLGTPVNWTGMTWSGFRPSDDACTYGYHIPSNLFAAKALEYVMGMFPDIEQANVLRQQILKGVQEHGTWADNDGKKRYCYEVDGLGGCNKMDDANVPSLLSIPYIDPDGYGHVIWKNTYDWIWSSKNPYFFTGTAAEGIGSPHTPHNYIWPMSIIIRGIVDPVQCQVMKALVEKTMTHNTIHESFEKDNPHRLTREDFAWPNALYQEMDC
jgi:meiotically up-regulated gene 157 (Mug157) protein